MDGFYDTSSCNDDFKETEYGPILEKLEYYSQNNFFNENTRLDLPSSLTEFDVYSDYVEILYTIFYLNDIIDR